jgi:hypothetical protein
MRSSRSSGFKEILYSSPHAWEGGRVVIVKTIWTAGLDIMEIDIHRVGVELKDGLKDQTENVFEKFIASLADNLSSPSSEMWT